MALDLENIVDLALFARVVDARSFSHAARQSGVAKSAVSRRIALLEKRVGVQLLRRSTRALEVTSDGARFYEHCKRVLSAAAEAEQSVRGASSSMRGSIRISAPVTFAHRFLTRPVAEFQMRYPELEIALWTDDRFVDPIAGEFDLVLRITRLADETFIAKRLARDRLVVAGAPSYFQSKGRPLRPEDLVHHPCLHYALIDAEAEWRFLGTDRRPVAFGRGNLVSNDGSVLRKAALAGLGLTVIPHFMVAKDVAEGRLELVLEGQRKAEVGIYAVVAKARGLPLRVRALIEQLEGHFARPNWREEE